MKTKRHLLVPEVVQSSAMDCGPASLKSLLEGFGIPVSYGRLREACQTDVDGTSIDTMEEVARQLGMDAEQIMLPPDHLFFPEAYSLPAIVVVLLPNGITHFVIVWRQHGSMLQVMDPATGRRWVTKRRFLEEVYVHKTSVPADAWREWAGSEASLAMLQRRLNDLGIPAPVLVSTALADSGWHKLGALDAAIRLVHSLVSSGGVRRGPQAARLLDQFLAAEEVIPAEYWSVRSNGDDELTLRGAVLVRVRGLIPHPPAKRDVAPPSPPADPGPSKNSRCSRAPKRTRRRGLRRYPGAPETEEDNSLPPELAAALDERPARPGRELLRLLRADGIFSPAFLILTLLLATGGVILEAVLFRGLFDLGRELGLLGQRLGAVVALLLFLIGLLFLEFPLASSLLKLGRHLETRLRQAFLEKLPRLGDRYFQSRLKSDMAERSHMIHRIRRLPDLGGQFLRSAFELALTVVGIAWLDPRSAPLAAAAAIAAALVPLAIQPVVTERDLRVRSHTGALCRYYLDALLGLVPIQVHGAQRAVRREHGKLLVDWARAGFGVQRVVVWAEATQFVLGFGLAAWLLFAHLARSGEGGGVLLLIYWALNLPVLGQELALAAWQYPVYRNLTLRLLEPLGALEEQSLVVSRSSLAEDSPANGQRPTTEECSSANDQRLATNDRSGVSIRLENVTVRAAGHTILDNVAADIPAGTHVAIVGPSGAGKSSLVGILLGWWRPAAGRVLIDGVPLAERLETLRRETAWVDPAVHLWNRSFFENLRYGCSNGNSRPIVEVMEAAELRHVLEKLPEGFETHLGEGGALVSGGEGQRVRLARALLRTNTRLVILDEPFRGLDRKQRHELLLRVRRLWRDATLFCITHDVSETEIFDRVLVLEDGKIVEDGAPAALAHEAGSRYRAWLEAERMLRESAWANHRWRSVRLEAGKVCTADVAPASTGAPASPVLANRGERPAVPSLRSEQALRASTPAVPVRGPEAGATIGEGEGRS